LNPEPTEHHRTQNNAVQLQVVEGHIVLCVLVEIDAS